LHTVKQSNFIAKSKNNTFHGLQAGKILAADALNTAIQQPLNAGYQKKFLQVAQTTQRVYFKEKLF
jgi:hypothetical protein